MKYLVQESAQVRLIAENGRAKLFELVKTDIEWGGFVVALKKATSKKIEFKVGWNGYRLASDAPLEKLKLIRVGKFPAPWGVICRNEPIHQQKS